jgi:hypothetical protein
MSPSCAEWRKSLREILGPGFKGLDKEWQLLCTRLPQQLEAVVSDRDLLESLMKLMAVADEACEGLGAPEDSGQEDDVFLELARNLTDSATLGLTIDNARVRVLPRMHTSQSGQTDRSLSLNLSLFGSNEVTPRWLTTPFLRDDSMNLLLVPWPLDVLVKQFGEAADTAAQLPEKLGFFTYDLIEDSDPMALVQLLHGEASRRLGRVDGVILPELALTEQQFRSMRDKLPRACFLIAGVGHGARGNQRGTNEARLAFPALDEVVQRKHHPWKLDEAQVIQYGRGGRLSPSRDWVVALKHHYPGLVGIHELHRSVPEFHLD